MEMVYYVERQCYLQVLCVIRFRVIPEHIHTNSHFSVTAKTFFIFLLINFISDCMSFQCVDNALISSVLISSWFDNWFNQTAAVYGVAQVEHLIECNETFHSIAELSEDNIGIPPEVCDHNFICPTAHK